MALVVFRLNPEKAVVALNPAGVAVRSIPAEVMLSLLPKPRAPKPQSLLWDECQNDRVPETSPALPGLVLRSYPGWTAWETGMLTQLFLMQHPNSEAPLFGDAEIFMLARQQLLCLDLYVLHGKIRFCAHGGYKV